MKTEKTNRIVETCKSLLEKYPKRRSFVLAKAAKFLQESGMGLVEIAEALYSPEGCGAGLVEVAEALYRGCNARLVEVARALHSSEGCGAEIEKIKTAITPLGSESGVKQAIENLSDAGKDKRDAERKDIEDAFESCQT